jgi:type III restriction enzyme
VLVLKSYQQGALQALQDYFAECSRSGDPDATFYLATRQRFGIGIPYHHIGGEPDLPSVCIRIPTGGGKTIVACYAAGIAARELLHTDRPLILWLVPSNPIKDQTLKALTSPAHPYRQVVEGWSPFPVEVMEVSDALHLQPAVLSGNTVIIVSTMQAFRVEDVTGRKVYESSSDLMPHFGGRAREPEFLERFDNGAVKHSLVNVLKIRRPIVVVDEAHNARTELSVETLARFRPSCVLEFTATPDTVRNPSNVLYSASAAELKAEAMIKVPIRLQTQADWKVALANTVSMQRELERISQAERELSGEYVRPIALIQAQPHRRDRQNVTVEVVRDHLRRGLRVPENQIAMATGDERDLAGIDVLDPGCEVRFVITVQALREGWDCPFAYILCSVAEMSSSTAVEQILGRVMRLPHASWKKKSELNVAYAFVTSEGFSQAAQSLADALVLNGFERQEARDLIARMPDARQANLFDHHEPPGEPAPPAPSVRSGPFTIPVLSVQSATLVEVFGAQHFLDEPWHLARCSPNLSSEDFTVRARQGQQGEIDVSERGTLQIRFVAELQSELLLLGESDWSQADLILWLDRQISHPDVTADESTIFITGALLYLIGSRGYKLQELGQDRYRLRDAITRLIDEHRRKARAGAFQHALVASDRPITVQPEIGFSYDPGQYPYNTRYNGAYVFRKHYYADVGELRPEGEEFQCAQFIDSLPEVDCWIRNLDKRPQHSFWLQTSTDRFYPDFVCKLRDGRFLVVEYKGEDRWSDDDSREKRLIGQLWEARSQGKCLFVMPKGRDLEAIRNKSADEKVPS